LDVHVLHSVLSPGCACKQFHIKIPGAFDNKC
jgi:hypothetical protein